MKTNNKDLEYGSYTNIQKVISLGSLIKYSSSYILDPPYARRFVWKPKFQKQLIWSILNGIPINYLQVVEKGDMSNVRIVLDGKQRIETIKRYVNNQFSISIEIQGKSVDLYWHDIISGRHQWLHDRVMYHQLIFVEYDPMPVKEQAKLYMKIKDWGNDAYSKRPA